MHELIITENIRDIALKYAEKERAAGITDLYLVIGDLSSVVDDSVSFYWDIVSKGTIAEGAALHFKRIPAEFSCLDCGNSFSPKENITCTNCESVNIKILTGQEFFLESIEIKEDLTSGDSANSNSLRQYDEHAAVGDQ